MLEHAGASPSASRVQVTQPSVHCRQFGGPFCIEKSSDAFGGGISSSAVRTLEPVKLDIARRATIKAKWRMPLSVGT